MGSLRATVLPIAIWAAHFALIYGFVGLACARNLTALVPSVVGVASAAAVLALLAMAIPAGIRAGRASRLADFLGAGLGALGAVAVLWEGSAVLFVAPCA